MKVTKNQLIDEIVKLFDELVEIYDGKLKELVESHKITTGHYYYVLSPYSNYHVKLFYGLDHQKAMISHKNNYTLWEFKYCLEQLKKHKEEMLKVVEEIA